MSELQISLLAIGALVILVVLVYNKWQERRLERSAQEGFRSGHEDVLLKRADKDAIHGAGADPANAAPALAPPLGLRPSDDESRIEPVMHTPMGATAQTVLATPDAGLDYVIEITFGEPVAGDLITSTSALALLPRARWEGLRADAGLWASLEASVTYTRVRASLQMVSRQGVRQQRDLELLGTAVTDTAQRLGGVLSGADPLAAYAGARELDIFCGEVDVQIALHLVSRDGVPFAGTKLRGLAEAAGMSLGTDKQFSFRNDDGLVLYCLVNKEAEPFHVEGMRELSTRGVSLLLDVPRVPGGATSFHSMVKLAQRLSQGLDAAIVDDNDKLLGERAFEAIAAQLSPLYARMEARGIAAGSPTALRLFS